METLSLIKVLLSTSGFLSNKAILRCVSPFLKTLLDEICPCSSVSLILPDVATESLSSFTDWLLAGCNGESRSGRKSWSDRNNISDQKLYFSEWNEILTLLGVKLSQEALGTGRDELLLRKLKHLDLGSPRNSSDTDMFLTDDESLSLSVCKAAQCDLSAEESGPGEPMGSMFLTDNDSKAA